jgi:hypothetical protein
VASLLKAIELDPNFVPVRWQLAAAYACMGASKEAIRECDTTLAMAPGNRFVRGIAMTYQAKCGHADEARKALTEFERNWRPDGLSSMWIAGTHALLGEKDAGFEWLGRALEERIPQLVYVARHPMFADLRSDPRFADLRRRMNLQP